MECERDKGNDRERLNFNKDNKDNSGELANLVIWFVMYRVYVGWKTGRSRTINNEIKRGYYAGWLGTISGG